jgi:glyoxylase-like metal-dependent hydrolase (beta-lactamase superfamily II)
MSAQPIIRAFFDEPTNTVSYLVADPATKQAAVIDPVLDYDHNAGEVDTRSVEAILRAAQEADYTILWALETHAHADHLSGSPLLRPRREQRSASASTSRTFNAFSGRCSTRRT